MNADQIERLGSELQSAITADNEEAALKFAIELLVGTATNLARIADALEQTD